MAVVFCKVFLGCKVIRGFRAIKAIKVIKDFKGLNERALFWQAGCRLFFGGVKIFSYYVKVFCSSADGLCLTLFMCGRRLCGMYGRRFFEESFSCLEFS